MKKCFVFAFLSAVSMPLAAQTASPVAQPVAPTQSAPVAAVVVPSSQESVLRAGTEIPMQTREELTTKKKKAKTGQRVQLAVASDVMQNGVIVIPAGTPGIGEITEVRNKGMWGKSGYISVRILSIRIGDRQIRVTGSFDDKGTTGTAGVVGAVAVLPVAGFFMTGTSAVIPMGTPVKAFLDEDIVYRPVQAAPQVIEVPVATPSPAAPAASQTP